MLCFIGWNHWSVIIWLHYITCDVGISLSPDHFVGLVVKASASRAEDLGFKSRLCWDFSGSSHTSDLKIGTPVAILPGAWCYRLSAGTGLPCVSILRLGEMDSLICNFCLSVAACRIVWADPSLRYTHMLLGRYATNKQQHHCRQVTSQAGNSFSALNTVLREKSRTVPFNVVIYTFFFSPGPVPSRWQTCWAAHPVWETL